MLAALLAAAEEEPSKAPYVIAGAALVAFALVMAFAGVRGAESFPPSKGVRTGVMLLCIVLVAATMATAVITA